MSLPVFCLALGYNLLYFGPVGTPMALQALERSGKYKKIWQGVMGPWTAAHWCSRPSSGWRDLVAPVVTTPLASSLETGVVFTSVTSLTLQTSVSLLFYFCLCFTRGQLTLFIWESDCRRGDLTALVSHHAVRSVPLRQTSQARLPPRPLVLYMWSRHLFLDVGNLGRIWNLPVVCACVCAWRDIWYDFYLVECPIY